MIRPMPGPSETLPVLEQRLTERLLDFDHLDEAWPRGRTASGQISNPDPPLSRLTRVAVRKGRGNRLTV